MKKLLFLLAVAGMISFVACKSGENKPEVTADDSLTNVPPVEQTSDSLTQSDSAK